MIVGGAKLAAARVQILAELDRFGGEEYDPSCVPVDLSVSQLISIWC